MKLHLISVGKQLPGWANEGFNTYWQRLVYPFEAQLHEIATAKRSKSLTPLQLKQYESKAIMSALPERSHVVALDSRGKLWNTLQLATQLQTWLELSKPVALLIGGPDGLADDCIQRADQQWSLTHLTFPHPLARVIVAEQLYRAQCILQNHPYHK